MPLRGATMVIVMNYACKMHEAGDAFQPLVECQESISKRVIQYGLDITYKQDGLFPELYD